MQRVGCRALNVACRSARGIPRSFRSAAVVQVPRSYYCKPAAGVDSDKEDLKTTSKSAIEDVEAVEVVGEVLETDKPLTDKIEKTEKVVGPSSKHEFQAETRKLLDIVAKSLYTDKEVSG